MSESKGGHSAKGRGGDYEERKPFKAFIDFDGVMMIDSFDIKRVEKGFRPSEDQPTGVSYYILIRFHSFPAERYFDYPDVNTRDRKLDLLRGKMLATGSISII